MTINYNALSSKFQVPTTKQRQKDAAFRKWQAVFYTLRYLIWSASKSNILKDAIANGTVQAGDIPNEVIQQLYSEAWQEFTAEFDAAFIKATLEEMVDFAKSRFGYSLEELLELNRERSAARYNR